MSESISQIDECIIHHLGIKLLLDEIEDSSLKLIAVQLVNLCDSYADIIKKQQTQIKEYFDIADRQQKRITELEAFLF